jgi:hypothetical protein
VRRDHRRHVEAARDDRRVRRDAADVGEKRAVVMVLELDHVGRRQVVRDEDRLLFGDRRRQRAGLAHEPLQDPLAHLNDVALALAQVRVLDLVELLDQHAHLLGQRPLRVAALLEDDLLRRLRQRGIGEDHPVHVEKGAELARHVAARHRDVQALELLLHFLHRVAEALDLRVHLGSGNRVVRDLERGVRDELRAADGDAARDSHTIEREADHHLVGKASALLDVDVRLKPDPHATTARRTRRETAPRSRAWLRPRPGRRPRSARSRRPKRSAA